MKCPECGFKLRPWGRGIYYCPLCRSQYYANTTGLKRLRRVIAYDELEKLIISGLHRIIARARGSCVTFTPKRVALEAGVEAKPITLTLVRDILEGLEEKGLVELYKNGCHGYKYIVTRESPLWQEAKRLAEEIALKVRG